MKSSINEFDNWGVCNPKQAKKPVFIGVSGIAKNLAPVSAPVISAFSLKKIDPMSDNFFPFRKAKLYDCKGDISKRWYINFYVWDVQRNSLVRKRMYEINNLSSIGERRAYAKKQIKAINEILEDGYHIDDSKISIPENVEIIQKT